MNILVTLLLQATLVGINIWAYLAHGRNPINIFAIGFILGMTVASIYVWIRD